jgi:hypothetical protein
VKKITKHRGRRGEYRTSSFDRSARTGSPSKDDVLDPFVLATYERFVNRIAEERCPASFGIMTDPSAWREADKNWFAAQPTRSHRIRRVFPGEWEEMFPVDAPAGFPRYHPCSHVIVQQIKPGARLRQPLGNANDVEATIALDAFPDDELYLLAFWQQIEEDANAPLGAVYARAAAMASLIVVDGGKQ